MNQLLRNISKLVILQNQLCDKLLTLYPQVCDFKFLFEIPKKAGVVLIALSGSFKSMEQA